MPHSEEEAIDRINALFKQCRLLHHKAYTSTSIDFGRLDLTGRVTHGQRAHARGNFSDVYKGRTDDETAVAIKSLRLPAYSSYTEKIYRDTVLRFFREFNHWSQLEHVNIVVMLGYSLSNGTISLVSHWHPNGNLVEYLHEHIGASKPDLALDVAEGIHYLHSRPSPLVHGDLKGANVLINEHGIACIADFGLSKQIDDLNRQTGFTTTSGATGTLPFTAPELNEGAQFGLPCDVYSCAGVFLQIYCPGKVPFDYMSNRYQIIQAKARGEAPRRSSYPEIEGQDALWQLMSNCWAYNPEQRPIMTTVVQELYGEFRVGPRPLHSNQLRPGLNVDPYQSTFAVRSKLVQAYAPYSPLALERPSWHARATDLHRVATEEPQGSFGTVPQVRGSDHIHPGNGLDALVMSSGGMLGDEGRPTTNEYLHLGLQHPQLKAYDQQLPPYHTIVPSRDSIHRGDTAARNPSSSHAGADLRTPHSLQSQLGGMRLELVELAHRLNPQRKLSPRSEEHYQGRQGGPGQHVGPFPVSLDMLRATAQAANASRATQQNNTPRTQAVNSNKNNIGGQQGPSQHPMLAPNQVRQGFAPEGTHAPFSDPAQDILQRSHLVAIRQESLASQWSTNQQAVPSNITLKRARSQWNTQPDSPSSPPISSLRAPKRARMSSQDRSASNPNAIAGCAPNALVNPGSSWQQQQPPRQVVSGYTMWPPSEGLTLSGGPGNQAPRYEDNPGSAGSQTTHQKRFSQPQTPHKLSPSHTSHNTLVPHSIFSTPTSGFSNDSSSINNESLELPSPAHLDYRPPLFHHVMVNDSTPATNNRGSPLYISTGFDVLGILAQVASRPNPSVVLGPIDLSCSFVVVDVRRYDQPIVYASPAFFELTGYDGPEVIGRNCRFLQAPDGIVDQGSTHTFTDHKAVAYLRKSLSLGKECQANLMNYRKGGVPFLNLVTVIPITWDSSKCIQYHVGFQVDLVHQPKAILQTMKDGTYLVDYRTPAYGLYPLKI